MSRRAVFYWVISTSKKRKIAYFPIAQTNCLRYIIDLCQICIVPSAGISCFIVFHLTVLCRYCISTNWWSVESLCWASLLVSFLSNSMFSLCVSVSHFENSQFFFFNCEYISNGSLLFLYCGLTIPLTIHSYIPLPLLGPPYSWYTTILELGQLITLQ